MAITRGSRLGPFEIVEPLGAGGMGEVYRAKDTRLEREVAVKVLPAELASDPERLKRFEKEARSASALNHPNIVTIHEIGSEGGVSYIAMERVEGQTLRELLVSGPMAVKKLLGLATQIAEGLAKAHEAGIVHRDLKPENVMVTKDGLVKILDFGLAKLTRTSSGSGGGSELPTMTGTTPGVVVGTVGYMSPEQASGQALDFRSDQFAFGSILYEMATGKRAFAKKTPIDTLAAILNEEPDPIATAKPLTPTPLRWTIERCLAKEAGDRYVATRDLARDLAAMRDHLSEISSSGAVGVAAPATKRTGVRVVAALAVAAVLAAGAYLIGRRSVPTAPPTYRRLTFRMGRVSNARFAPDGRTVIYAASWNGRPSELFLMRPESPDSHALGVKDAELFSISSKGEMAILRGSTLARLPLAGGAPRDVLENVTSADWSPDGSELAVVLDDERLEFPAGRVVLDTKLLQIGNVALSRDGRLLAVGEVPRGAGGCSLEIFDREGKRRARSTGWGALPFARWSPRGNELWFSSYRGASGRQLWAMELSGRVRPLATFPGSMFLYDVSPTGEALVARQIFRTEMAGKLAGFTEARELDWFDRSESAFLSADGATLIFNERGESSESGGAVFLRRAGDAEPVKLGEGYAAGLAPDGRWVAAQEFGTGQLLLLPTGAGGVRRLELSPPIQWDSKVFFLPDGKSLLLRGLRAGATPRIYRVDIATGKTMPVGPESLDPLAVSPDGKQMLLRSEDLESFRLWSIETGDTRPFAALGKKDGSSLTWSADGKSLFVHRHDGKTINVFRVDVETGKREPLMTLTSPDPTGVASPPEPLISADGKSYVYQYSRTTNDLYLVEGLR